MKYIPPLNGDTSNANRPWVDADPANGVEGSIPGASAFEHPLRELVALIQGNGFTPSESDLQQVSRAVRSQKLNYASAGGTANALTVTLSPALSAYSDGMPLRVKISTTNTGAATLNAVPIKTLRGLDVQAGDLTAGAIITLLYDGATSTWMLAGHSYSEVGSFSRLIMSATSGSFTATANERKMHVRAWGGGGGGGYSTGSSSGGAGGGGGGYFESWVTITPGTTYTYTVGAGGAAGTGAASAGTGGTTSITGIGTATGGTGGFSGSSGSPGANGGTGGTGTLISGQGVALSGAQGGTSIIVAPTSLVGGTGGMSPFGGSNGLPTQGAAGIDGNFPGGGGGGAANVSGLYNGGAGASGYVIIETYGA